MPDLHYVPLEEFRRVLAFPCPLEDRARVFTALCRLNALYMIKRAGSGHPGSTLSSLDIVSWLFLRELKPGEPVPEGWVRPVYFSSKGHDVPGLYSVLIGLGLLPFDLLHELRRKGGLTGHPDVSIPFMETNTGSLGMGISKAKGMIRAARLEKKRSRVFVLTGDGELQEGQIWEALQGAANDRMHELTVIVDHNKVQSDTWVRCVSDLGDLARKAEAFGWQAVRIDGHDFVALGAALAAANESTERPHFIIADTVKGKGVSFMEHTRLGPDDLYKFHSGAPKDPDYTRASDELLAAANAELARLGAAPLALLAKEQPPRPSMEGVERLVNAYTRALIEQAERNPRIAVLDADLVLDCGLIPFRERFPDRFIECGIAEQDMVSQAGGMALRGALPIVHSFACFLSSRPNEHIYNNATERTKVIYVASLAGILPGGPGHSHQCVRDISALGSVPRLIMIEPSNEAEVPLALDFAVNGTAESSYLRLVSVGWRLPFELPPGYRLEVGRGAVLREGHDAVVFGYGPVFLTQACEAAAILAERRGVSLKVVSLPWLNRIDPAWLRATVEGLPWVFTLDNHYLKGGQGEMIAAALAELALERSPRVKRFGIETLQVCGQNDEVLRAHGLDAESLAQGMAAHVAMARAGVASGA